jgi:hypothetical protein
MKLTKGKLIETIRKKNMDNLSGKEDSGNLYKKSKPSLQAISANRMDSRNRQEQWQTKKTNRGLGNRDGKESI